MFEGVITRSRKVNEKNEDSVIDFAIVCEKIFPYFTKLLIDEKKIYSLTNYSCKTKTVYSDHNSLVMNVNLEYQKQKQERKIVFNFRNLNSLRKFKTSTTNTNKFTTCFNEIEPFSKQVKQWSNLFNGTIRKCFERVRMRKNK